ncbi:hypothetical protein JF50_11395 [Pseudoalteromonas luteoviolacea]|uniref:Uncharacterized protein n=1 Tax=Pseudoalteromonas luteoviolacea TaxID=43657 RepID=A0A0C1QNA0_9GAMM|nr:hypothetical protein [Pseudoalteromonas luteoviolacea]KID56542.1 hypothetical protein JF50_11395 [Pseudoalteromonas luteoviolacea]
MKNFIISIVKLTKRHAIDTALLMTLTLGASLVTDNGIWKYIPFILSITDTPSEPRIYDLVLGYILIFSSVSVLCIKHFSEINHKRKLELLQLNEKIKEREYKHQADMLIQQENHEKECHAHELAVKEKDYQIERMKIKGDGVLKARELNNIRELESEKVALDAKRVDLEAKILVLKEAAKDQEAHRTNTKNVLKDL